jgi:hypothetical protein
MMKLLPFITNNLVVFFKRKQRQACEDHRLQALTFCWQIEIVRDVTTIAALIPLRPQPAGLHRTTLTPGRPIGLSG